MTTHGMSRHRPVRRAALAAARRCSPWPPRACGGTTTSAPPRRARRRRPRRLPRRAVGPGVRAARRPTPATPARRPTIATRSGATRRRSRTSRRSWTRSTRRTRRSPSRSTVSDWDTYWDKLQTGIAGGDAPDVFAMDGPLFPDYQTRDVLLDLKPYIDEDGYDLDPAGRPGRRRLHDPRRPVRPAARPQRRSPSSTTRRCSTRPASPIRTTPGTGRSSSRSPRS